MMDKNLATVLNAQTGEVGQISRRLLRIPSIGGILVEVPAGTKSYDPEFYKPQTPEEFVEAHPEKVVTASKQKTADENEEETD